jgi:peptide/nickel transport system ATP-binding protein
MYLGTVAEVGRAEDVFAPPYHPYTEALLSAVPVPDPDAQGARIILEGSLPSATELARGCPFSSRCPRRIGSICDETQPPTRELARGHRITCHIPIEELGRLPRLSP